MTDYHFKIQSNTKNIAPLLRELKTKWETAGLDEKTIFSLHLALEEALVNAIKHGNKNQEKLPVDLICRVLPDRVELVVTDKGKGFDLTEVPNPTSEENIGKNSGRGVFLIKNFCDKVEFLENGRKIKFTKFRDIQGGNMKISREVDNGIFICKIEGEINIDNSHQLRTVFDELIKDEANKVIIDFSPLNYIDSSGLATLIEMFQRLKKIGGDLRICGLNSTVKSVFEITKLNTLFAIYDKIEDAREGF